MLVRSLDLQISSPEDVEELWRLFEELRDCQDSLSKLPKYVSGWKRADTSEGSYLHLVRNPVGLDNGRVLNAGVRVYPNRHADIIVRITE